MRTGTKHTARLTFALGVVSATVMMMSAIAWASHGYVEISIPVDTVVRAPVNSITLLETADVPSGFADHLCEVRAHAENQTSIHPGNDLVIESGDSRVVLADVEAQPGQVIETEDMLELGEQITVSLVMGPDGVFSAGIEVVVECFAEETTTTAEVAPTEATTTTAEVAPSEVTSTQAASTSVADEVKGTEVLPFTGAGSSQTGLLALALLAGGTLVVVSARRRED